MFQVRIHGRGGQGVVTAAELLSVAAFGEGRHAQAFPSFGSERTGAPVVAFCRIDDRPIRVREPIAEPDALIVQDPTLLHQVDVFDGLDARRLRADQHRAQLRRARPRRARDAVPPRAAAHRAGDRDRPRAPRPAAAQRRAARRLRRAHRAGLARRRCAAAIRERFSGAVGEGNVAAAERGVRAMSSEQLRSRPVLRADRGLAGGRRGRRAAAGPR